MPTIIITYKTTEQETDLSTILFSFSSTIYDTNFSTEFQTFTPAFLSTVFATSCTPYQFSDKSTCGFSKLYSNFSTNVSTNM
jgi:hypothetical protein